MRDHVHRNSQRSQRLKFRNIEIGNAQQRLPADGNVDDRRSAAARTCHTVAIACIASNGRLPDVGERVRPTRRSPRVSHCVGIAAPIQQEVLVLHVREAFRVKRHAHEVEVRIEAVNLQWDTRRRTPWNHRHRCRRTASGGRLVASVESRSAWLRQRAGSGFVHRMSCSGLQAVRGSPCCACSAL